MDLNKGKAIKGPTIKPITTSVLLYVIVGVIAFAPLLLGGQVYFDGDLFGFSYIVRTYLRDILLQGHIPLWDPYLFGGQPFLADANCMVCYPFLYLTLLFPVGYGFAVFYLSTFLIAALGMHFWLKSLKVSEEASRLGALIFVLSGYFWWEVLHPPELAALAWTPWWVAALEKASEKLKPGWFFAAGLILVFLFTAGNFQLTLATLYGGAAYFVFRLLSRRDWRKERNSDRRLLLAPLFFLWGSLPLLAFWIPAWEFMSRCDRLNGHLDYATFLADYSLDPARLWQFLYPINPFPDSAGPVRPMDDLLANGGYLGPWALFLIALAFRDSRKKLIYFLAAAGTAALLLAFGKYTPVHRWVCEGVPGFGLARAPFRYVFLYVAVCSVLAAVGYEKILETYGKKGKQEAPFLKWAAVYATVVAGMSLFQGFQNAIQWLGLALGFLGLAVVTRKWVLPAAKWIFPASIILTLLFSGWAICTTRWGPSSNFNWVTNSPVLSKLKEDTGLARAFIGDDIPCPVQTAGKELQMELPTNAAMAAEIRSVGGYNPLCLQNVSDLFTLPPRNLVRLMAVKDYISGDSAHWHMDGFSCADLGPVKYCQNEEPVSFLYAPIQVRTFADSQARLDVLRQPSFNPYEVSYFDESVPDFTAASPAGLQYDLKWEKPDEELFGVTMGRAGWVVFSEVMYPGWKAWVDGKPSDLYTANHAFRAVWVPAGEHEVRFGYEPGWLKPLLGGLALWFLSVAGFFFGPWGKKFLQEFRN